MAEKVTFELVAPERLLMSGEVEMIVLPGSEGDFGVLAGHAPVISTIRPGVIEVHDGNAVSERLFVSGGMVEVTPEACTVLAEDAVNVKEIDRAAAEQRLKDAREDVNLARDPHELAKAEKAAAIAEAMVEAVA